MGAIARGPWLGWLAALLYGLWAVMILGPQPWASVIGAGDTDLWEYTGFYLREHWRWWPLPHLLLETDRALYPYGGPVALQAWGLERDLFWAALSAIWGPGPWLKLYFLLSVAIALVGMARILRPDFGERRAIGTAIGAVLLNVYAIVGKFPVHSNIAITHWTALSLTMDFVLVHRWARGRAIERVWWLGRAALVLLSLGQDLGYVAGFGLLSLALSLGWMGAIALGRWGRGQSGSLQTRAQSLIQALHGYLNHRHLDHQWMAPGASWRQPLRPIEWGCVGAIAAATWLYLLPVLPIVRAAKAFDWSNTFDRAWFAHPLRLLAPYWPGINPIEAADWWRSLLPSPLETDFDGVVGWGLLLAGVIGLVRGRRHWAVVVPLWLMAIGLLAYRPWDLPLLQIFPWFSFNRVAGRGTVVLPVLLALLSLGWSADWRRSRFDRWAVLLVAIAGLLDLTGGYGLKLREQPSQLDRSFWPYISTLRQQPGVAVLDWPFCVTGGNGVGSGDGTCPFFAHNPSTHALSRFHGKTTISSYLGRMHPSQVAPFVQAGWPLLALPDDPDVNRTQRQRRCFWDDEWAFFERFLQLGDFAGVNLYLDRLAPGCEGQFFAQLGQPIAQTSIPGMGRLVFLPKPAAWQSLIDLEQVRSLRFEPAIDGREPDLVQFGAVRGVAIVSGLDRPRNGRRWGLAPETVLDLRVDRPQTLRLQLQARVPVADQSLKILLGDRLLWQADRLVEGQTLVLDLPAKVPAGRSRLRLIYGRSRFLRDQVPAAGNRPIALTFDRFAIQPITP
ncbi:MAG: hypothetical protein EA001_02910 [Oscillatoriales cyanobacterium]|nr:MAG: hypothetical protein EA001_02910 [Oscillatoriales cyanobacterium]